MEQVIDLARKPLYTLLAQEQLGPTKNVDGPFLGIIYDHVFQTPACKVSSSFNDEKVFACLLRQHPSCNV